MQFIWVPNAWYVYYELVVRILTVYLSNGYNCWNWNVSHFKCIFACIQFFINKRARAHFVRLFDIQLPAGKLNICNNSPGNEYNAFWAKEMKKSKKKKQIRTKTALISWLLAVSVECCIVKKVKSNGHWMAEMVYFNQKWIGNEHTKR